MPERKLPKSFIKTKFSYLGDWERFISCSSFSNHPKNGKNFFLPIILSWSSLQTTSENVK